MLHSLIFSTLQRERVNMLFILFSLREHHNLKGSFSSVFSFGTFFFLKRPHKATAEEMTKFHSDDYIKFLRSIRPDNMSEYNKQMQRCKWSLFTFFLDSNHNLTILASNADASYLFLFFFFKSLYLVSGWVGGLNK